MNILHAISGGSDFPPQHREESDGASLTVKTGIVGRRSLDTADIASQKSLSPLPIRRSFSTSKLSDLTDEKKECEERSGTFWKCLRRRPSPSGIGYIYEFEAVEEYDNRLCHMDHAEREKRVEEMTHKQYPAVEYSTKAAMEAWWEPCNEEEERDLENRIREAVNQILRTPFYMAMAEGATSMYELLKKQMLERVNLEIESDRHNRQLLRLCGYRFYTSEDGEVMMELPDLEALLDGWKRLRLKNPEMDLLSLDLLASEGIADDITFAEGYVISDALLSKGKEFVHDHQVHVATRLLRMLKGAISYRAEKMRLVRQIHSIFRTSYLACEKTKLVLKRIDSIEMPAVCSVETKELAREIKERAREVHNKQEKLLAVFLGAVVDTVTGYSQDSAVEALVGTDFGTEAVLTALSIHGSWGRYLEERFPGEDAQDHIREAWQWAKAEAD